MPHTYETFSIGNSREGRPMPVHVFKSTGKELFRVLFYHQVHGIEGETGEGGRRFIDDVKLNPGGYYDDVSIAVIPTCNVDGAFHQTYTTPIGWDMDIDSMSRYTPENRNLFGFVKIWKPQVAVDGHNLNLWFAGSEYAESRNYSRPDDFVITKLETQIPRKDITWKQARDMYKELNTTFPQYEWSEYWHIHDAEPYDGSRSITDYYTPDIALPYQFMAQRYNTVGFLTEGLSPQSLEDQEELFAERTEVAIQTNFLFLKFLVNYFKRHSELVPKKVCPLPQGTEMPVRWKKIYHLQQFQHIVRDRNNYPNGTIKNYVSDEYQQYYEPTEFVTIPLGYAYPNTEELGVLTYYLGPQYDFKLFIGSSNDVYDIETIHISSAEEGARYEDVHHTWQEAPINVSTFNIDSTMSNFSDWVVTFCDQEGGHMLPQLLEPVSQFALTRYYEEVNLNVFPDTDYVVKRLIKKIA